jgi:hypothetical protein
VAILAVRATAEAVRAYQRSVGAAQEAVDAATEIRLRAKRRLGEELEAGQDLGELATRADGTAIRDHVPEGIMLAKSDQHRCLSGTLVHVWMPR